MVRRIESETATHVAGERCGVIAAPDGSHAAIIESGRIVVIDLAHGATVAEVGVATTPEHTDVAWIGASARLIVLSRRGTHSTVHLIDIEGPRARAEIQIEGMMRIASTVGPHALVIGASSTAVLTAGDAPAAPYHPPSRAVPAAVGAAARQFVVAVGGAIEEWDPQQRAPRKRLRLPRPAAISQVGGNERLVWMTTQQDPARIDVIVHVNRSQPKVHELPEPIAHVSAHPQRDLLACLGRETGAVYVVDLEGRAALRPLYLGGLGRVGAVALFAGGTVGVGAARAGEPVRLFPLDGRGPVMSTPSPAAHDSTDGSTGGASVARNGDSGDAPRRSTLYDSPFGEDDGAPRHTEQGAGAPSAASAGSALGASGATASGATASSARASGAPASGVRLSGGLASGGLASGGSSSATGSSSAVTPSAAAP